MSVFYRGDSLSIIKSQVANKSVNLIYINPPFGTTKNYWDSKQDWVALFKEFFRILKDDGMLVIHCSIPFNYELIRAAPKAPLYSWYWLKERPTCPLIANKQPLRIMEEILVWKNKKTTYYRQQVGDELRTSSYMTPNGYYGNTVKHRTELKGETRTHLLTMKRKIDGFSTRPDEMVKLIIDSYTKKGDTILDLFCYKGVSYTHSKDRKWIGIDKNFIPTNLFIFNL
jgi:site-specific DNA-methyltransferase (adenine-specific)